MAKRVLVSLLGIPVAYMVFSFIMTDIDFRDWPAQIRALSVVLALWSIGWLFYCPLWDRNDGGKCDGRREKEFHDL